ncbi:helix-turn-helix domain-containing protein [Dyadobacter crusticola]|uniref:helix-turn-helix domain-containing protein n=1 Tax=Dyadobacter crusticola TaxID=292407 RepID=UPI000A4F0414|nr:helix-turn-helix domain-containing protein [Dyadobacter crusticola]
MRLQNDIPEYSISGHARQGVLIANLLNVAEHQRHDVGAPHRDDHFTFLVVTSGSLELMVDFEQLSIEKEAALIIRPEQVHQILGMSNATGWLLNVDAAVIGPEMLASVYAQFRGPVLLDSDFVATKLILSLSTAIEALRSQNSDAFLDRASLHLVNALFELVISLAVAQKPTSRPSDRGLVIYQQFQSLLQDHFKEWKQPHLYAQAISLSAVHVNDLVRKQSGHSVSHHIQARNVLEAKRLLFYTDKNINEIAFMLGYEDPLYFGKLFKKHTQLSPTQFRTRYRI